MSLAEASIEPRGTASKTMRIVRQRSLGGPDVLEATEAPRPNPGPTEVLVRTAAAGVNPVDWKTRADGGMLGRPPFTVGWDVAGVVEAVGGGVTRFAVGDRVFGMPRFPREAAAYAEYVTSPSRQLARTPERLSDVEAAALPLAALTAWQALVDTADVQPGQRVLVHAGAGGWAILPCRSPRHAAPT
jgi:NADPH:quinone reductase-like Zn-dependent oxidoreductase